MNRMQHFYGAVGKFEFPINWVDLYLFRFLRLGSCWDTDFTSMRIIPLMQRRGWRLESHIFSIFLDCNWGLGGYLPPGIWPLAWVLYFPFFLPERSWGSEAGQEFGFWRCHGDGEETGLLKRDGPISRYLPRYSSSFLIPGIKSILC
jgi:hypothetical protein